MHKTISLLLPTRGRPELAKRFLASVLEQSAHPELIEVIVCVDEDDAASHGITVDGLKLNEIIVPRQNMGAYNALCLGLSTGEIIIAVNDDMVVRTKDWDERVRDIDARFSDGIYLAYGNDLFKGKNLCTFPILSRRTCQVMSGPFPDDYRGAFIDVHLMDIFHRLRKGGYQRIIYSPTLVFEHLHHRVVPNVMDKTYAERPRFADDLIFMGLADQRQSDALRLVKAIKGIGEPESPVKAFSLLRRSPNYLSILSLCFRQFALDAQLPWRWRFKLMIWMIARYYYCRLVLWEDYSQAAVRSDGN